MYITVRCLRPAVLVETGVLYGSTSAFILEAMERNGRGRLHSIDLPTFSPEGSINEDGILDGPHVAAPSEVGCLVPADRRSRWDQGFAGEPSCEPEDLVGVGRLGPRSPVMQSLIGDLAVLGRMSLHDAASASATAFWDRHATIELVGLFGFVTGLGGVLFASLPIACGGFGVLVLAETDVVPRWAPATITVGLTLVLVAVGIYLIR